jgi:hypothetical protein
MRSVLNDGVWRHRRTELPTTSVPAASATSTLTRLTPDERDLCVELVEDGLGELLTDYFLKDFVSGMGLRYVGHR